MECTPGCVTTDQYCWFRALVGSPSNIDAKSTINYCYIHKCTISDSPDFVQLSHQSTRGFKGFMSATSEPQRTRTSCGRKFSFYPWTISDWMIDLMPSRVLGIQQWPCQPASHTPDIQLCLICLFDLILYVLSTIVQL